MKERILKLRLGIIVILNSFPFLLNNSREKSMAFTSTQNASMWTGKMLEYGTDEPNPYPDSSNPENSKVEPTANTTDETFETHPNHVDFYRLEDGIPQIKYFRQELDILQKEISDIMQGGQYSADFAESSRQVWKYLVEAKMQLGLELSNVAKKTNS